ncbi:MAG: hypothetical protein K2X74_10570 [Acetobacteraceae bacterium]|nr:hypothetical protein [Acetobacteraceae bacterium]
MTHPHPLPRRALLGGGAALAALAGGGCTSIGPTRLDRDQLDYARVIANSGKRQTLFNLVRLRFGEPPSFVAISQVVSGYTLQNTAQGNFQVNPSGAINSFWALLGSTQFSDRPTFTLDPITGERFVEAYMRPFAPASVLPLIDGGIPVDMLFRLMAQSVGSLQNTHPLGGPSRSGSPEFPQLLDWLRQLQEGGALRVRVRRERDHTRVFVSFDTGRAPGLRSLAERVYRMLAVDPAAPEVEVIYGAQPSSARAREIPVLTRSLLNVLYAVAAEIEIAPEDVAAQRAPPTLREPGASRPVIRILSGDRAPANTYAEVQVRDRWYWIEDTDYQSKLTFTILELLKRIAEGGRGAAPPVLTIPTG